MSRITFVSTYRDLTLLVQSVADEMNIKIETVEGIMTESGWVGEARSVEQDAILLNSDVLISRGGTAFYLERNLGLPVVNINTGPFDLIAHCNKAKKICPNIAITTFKPFVGLTLIEEILDVPITEMVIKSLAQLEIEIAELAKEGNYCIVGGGQSVLYANKYGLPSVFLHTSRDTVRDALLRAEELAKLHFEEKRRAIRLKAILDCAYEGILAIDENGIVDIYNSAAERIFGVEATKVIGRDVREIVPNTRLHELLSDSQAQVSEFQDVGDVRIVTNRVPVQAGTTILGAVATFQEAAKITQIEHQMRRELTEQRFRSKKKLADILGESSVIKQKKDLARKFATSDLTVFINGPSGTGKELFAQGIHHASKRAAGPFVGINCGALPPSLLESELFGYAEGSFTGAKRKGKPGLFELAHGGTVFLDEIDAMSIDMQGRLLRVLQEREVMRIGGEGIIPVDIRVIAASNKSPQDLLRKILIREDLFYRLNVLYLEIPPLSMRKEDIPLLCQDFLPFAEKAAAAPLLQELMPYLMNYSWPGNIRELLNFMQRLAFFLDDYRAGTTALELLRNIAPDLMIETEQATLPEDLKEKIGLYEEKLINQVLQNSTSIADAAAQLGMPKTTLWRKLQKRKGKEGVSGT